MGAFCPSCGSQVEADWRFCRSCGSEQPISAAPSTPDPSAIADVAAPAASTTVERSDADRLAAMRLAEVEADRAAEAARQAELERQAELAAEAERRAEAERTAELERQAEAEREAQARAEAARLEAEAAAEAARIKAAEEAEAEKQAAYARAHAEAAADAERKAADAAQSVAAARAEAQARAETVAAAAELARAEAEAAARHEVAAQQRLAETSTDATPADRAPLGYGSPEPDPELETSLLAAAAAAINSGAVTEVDPDGLDLSASADTPIDDTPIDDTAIDDTGEEGPPAPDEVAAATTPRRLTAASPLATRTRTAAEASPAQVDEPAAAIDAPLFPSTNAASVFEPEPEQEHADQQPEVSVGTYRPPGPTAGLARKGLILAALLCLVTVGALVRLNLMLDDILAGELDEFSRATDAQSIINNVLLPLVVLTTVGSYVLVGSWALTIHRNLRLVQADSANSDAAVRWGLAIPIVNLVVGKGIFDNLSRTPTPEAPRRTNPWVLAWWVLSLAGLLIAAVGLLNGSGTVAEASGANSWSAIGYALLALSLLCCVVVVATLTYEHERWAVTEFGLPRTMRPRHTALARLGFAPPPEPTTAHDE